MVDGQPRIEEAYEPGTGSPIPWEQASDDLANAGSYWLATVRPDSSPHVVPLLAVWAEGRLHFAASPESRKARNLSLSPHAVITTSSDVLDLVVEGDATRVKDDVHLDSVATAYASKYGWQVEVRDGAFHAEGAPTAGPPPYDVYELRHSKALAFPTEGTLVPTRWRF